MRTTFSFARSAFRPPADLMLGGVVYVIALAPALVGLPIKPDAAAWASCLGYVVVATVVGVNAVSAVAIANGTLGLAQLALLVLSALCTLILYLSALDWLIARDATELAFVGGLVGVDGVWVRRALIVLMAAFLLVASLIWPLMIPRSCPCRPVPETAQVGGASDHGRGKRAGSNSRPKPEDARPPGSASSATVNRGGDSPNAQNADGVAAAHTGRDRSFRWTAGLCVAVVSVLLVGTAFTSAPPKVGTSDCAVLGSQLTRPEGAASKPGGAEEAVPKVEIPTVERKKRTTPREGPKDGRSGGSRPPP
jgi:hypothetical protein